MIMVQMNPESWVPLDKIELVGWDNEHACPAVWTNAYKVPATLFADAPGDRAAKIEALVAHIAAVQRLEVSGLDDDLLPPVRAWSDPPPPAEHVFVDKAHGLIEHAGANPHSADAKAVSQCRICTPRRLS
jgi:hypothetical protein